LVIFIYLLYKHKNIHTYYYLWSNPSKTTKLWTNAYTGSNSISIMITWLW